MAGVLRNGLLLSFGGLGEIERENKLLARIEVSGNAQQMEIWPQPATIATFLAATCNNKKNPSRNIGLLSRNKVIWQPATNSFWQLATNSKILSISATNEKKCGNKYPLEIPQYAPKIGRPFSRKKIEKIFYAFALSYFCVLMHMQANPVG